MYKRKRTYQGTSYVPKRARYTPSNPYRRRIQSIPSRYNGYVRTVGNYGRYNKRPTSEIKAKDYTYATSSSASAHTVSQSLCAIPQGTAVDQRIGKTITLTAVQLKLVVRRSFIQNDPYSSQATIHFRLVIIYDRQSNGLVTQYLDVFKDDTFNSFRNLTNSSRFIILYDKPHTLTAQTTGTILSETQLNEAEVQLDIYKKCNLKVEYDATKATANVTDIKTGNVSVLIKADGICQYEGHCRVRYSDK